MADQLKKTLAWAIIGIATVLGVLGAIFLILVFPFIVPDGWVLDVVFGIVGGNFAIIWAFEEVV